MSEPAPAAIERTRVSIRNGPLVGPVLSRLVAIHGSRAPLSVERLQDALLIADSIAAQAPAYSTEGCLPVSLKAGGGQLELRVGPLRSGGAEELLERATMPQTGNVLTRLADDVRIRAGSGGTGYLVLSIGETAAT